MQDFSYNNMLSTLILLIFCYVLQIKGFPTIKFFPQGPKDGSAEEYDGGRTASDIITWASEKHSEFTPPPEVLQVL